MYSVKVFKVAKAGSVAGFFSSKTASSDVGMTQNIYQQIADHANKHKLDVVKISNTDETLMGKTGVTVLFKSK